MKRALVISGGGSRGAFAAGVLQGLRNMIPDLHFDLIVGTSTGALIAPLAALKEYDLLEGIYTSQKTHNVIRKYRFGDRIRLSSIFSVEPLWELINRHMSDERYWQIMGSGTGVFIVTTCLQTGNIVVFTSYPSSGPPRGYVIKTLRDAEHLRLSVLASACQPVFMPPVKVDEHYEAGEEKEFQYVDGGVREFAGIRMALDQGAEEIFCILHSANGSSSNFIPYRDLYSILQRTISMMSEDISGNDLLFAEQQAKNSNFLYSLKARMQADGISAKRIKNYFSQEDLNDLYPVQLHIIRPATPLGGGPGGLDFDPKEMKGMVLEGYEQAERFWETKGSEKSEA